MLLGIIQFTAFWHYIGPNRSYFKYHPVCPRPEFQISKCRTSTSRLNVEELCHVLVVPHLVVIGQDLVEDVAELALCLHVIVPLVLLERNSVLCSNTGDIQRIVCSKNRQIS